MLQFGCHLLVYVGILALFSSLSIAWTIPILGLGTSPPPAALITTDISPQCVDANNGTYLCCAATFNGGFPLVADAADLAGYQLPANTVNGIVCKWHRPRRDVRYAEKC
jgi:hypothetical protein